MVKHFLFLTLVLFAFNSVAQKHDTCYVRSGLLKTNGTIALSLMPKYNSTNLYFNGSLEYYPESKVSIKGSSLYYLTNTNSNNSIYKSNVQIYFGALYHFNYKLHDVGIGIQPGISYTDLSFNYFVTNNLINNQNYQNRNSILIPTVALAASYNFYFYDYFDFFLECRYIHSTFFGNALGDIPLHQIMIGGGLGFHINTKMKKHI